MRKVVTVAAATAVLALGLSTPSGAARRDHFTRLPGRGVVPVSAPASLRAGGLVTASVQLGAASLDVVAARVTDLGGSVLYRLDHAANAVVVQVPGDQLAALQAIPGVVQVLASQRVAHASAPVNLDYTGVSSTWSALGSTGTGVKVGVIDDGVDYKHADFGGPNPVVAGDHESDDGETEDNGDNRDQNSGRDGNDRSSSSTSSSMPAGSGSSGSGSSGSGNDARRASFRQGDDAGSTSNDHQTNEHGTSNPAFPTAKVVGGWDFVGDAFDANSADPARRVPQPDADPMACQDHGTHVAGIVAGQGVAADGTPFTGPYTPAAVSALALPPGAAPEALLYAYKVFGCDGDTTDAIVASAIDRAVADGVDVLVLSLGASYGGVDSLTSVAADNASVAGVTVVAAAGNDGPSAYLVAAPGVADRALSVGAVDASSPSFPAATIAVNPALSAINANGASFGHVAGRLHVLTANPIEPGTFPVIALGCAQADYTSVRSGDIVVVRRGQCLRSDKAALATAAGAATVILVNTQAGVPPFEGPLPGVTIPFLGVSSSAAAALVAAEGTTVAIDPSADLVNTGYGQSAPFSSGGPRSGDSAIKPDVSAPGVSVLSAAAGTTAAGKLLSGTSMAAPQVAGVAALIHGLHPNWPPGAVKAAITNTADASPARLKNPNSRVAGTGVVDGARAVGALVMATTADGTNGLSFGYRPAKGAITASHAFSIENHSPQSVTYDLASSFNGGRGADRGARVDVTPARVTVAAGDTAEVKVTLAMDASAVAKLPGASQPAGQLVTVRGDVTATPAVESPGAFPLKVPFLVAPRGLSDVTGSLGPLTVAGTAASADVTVSNLGLHNGTVDVYAWLQTDRVGDAPGSSADLTSVGVQTYPGDFLGSTVPDDRALVFAVNAATRWSTASSIEIDVPLDTDGDGVVDHTVVGADYGQVMNGTDNGQFASFTFDRAGRIVDVYIADAPMNGSTVLLPTLASSLGMSAVNNHAIRVQTQSFDRLTGVLDVVGTPGFWNPYQPTLSTADVIEVRGGTEEHLAATVDLAAAAAMPVKGWILVTLDDRSGTGQADTLPLLLP